MHCGSKNMLQADFPRHPYWARHWPQKRWGTQRETTRGGGGGQAATTLREVDCGKPIEEGQRHTKGTSGTLRV